MKDRKKTQEMIESAKDAPLVMSNEELWVTLKELGASTREEETVEATVCHCFPPHTSSAFIEVKGRFRVEGAGDIPGLGEGQHRRDLPAGHPTV